MNITSILEKVPKKWRGNPQQRGNTADGGFSDFGDGIQEEHKRHRREVFLGESSSEQLVTMSFCGMFSGLVVP